MPVRMRALTYAQSLGIEDLRAVSFAFDERERRPVPRRMAACRADLPLDLSDAPYRDIGTPLRAYIRELTATRRRSSTS